MLTIIMMAAALLLAVTTPGCAAEQRSATVWWQGVDAFDKAKADNAVEASVRRNGKSGDVARDAIFLHPKGEGRASAQYPPVSVKVPAGQRVFFLGYVGLSDGFKWDDPEHVPDGARFYVLVNGKEMLTEWAKASRWMPEAAELYQAPATGEGSFDAQVTLQTDCGTEGNINYDWALFGEPMIVALDGQALAAGAAVAGTGGVLVAKIDSGAGKLTVQGVDEKGAAVEGAVATAEVPEGAKYGFVRFDFGKDAKCAAWQWQAEGVKVAAAWGGSWRPQLVVDRLGLAQAVNFEGEKLRVRVTVRNAGMGAILPEDQVTVEYPTGSEKVAHLAPGETTMVGFEVPTAEKAVESVRVRVTGKEMTQYVGTLGVAGNLWPKLPELPAGRAEHAQSKDYGDDYLLVENTECRWVIWKKAAGLGAIVYVWDGTKWEQVGSVSPWLEIATTATESMSPKFDSVTAKPGAAGSELLATGTVMTGGGANLNCTVKAELGDSGPALRVATTVAAVQQTSLSAVWGPAVHAGDRTTGANKGVAMFPGLEYLEDGEQSSSTRDLAPPLSDREVPHKFKVTVPMMCVETRPGGPVVGVAWDARQKWDGTHVAPAACFASPDFVTSQDSHLMQLGMPSSGDEMPENTRRAARPVELLAGGSWRLVEFIFAGTPKPDASATLEWFDKFVGYPEAETPARSFEEEMALSRHGFMVTVWDAATNKSMHYAGSGKANAPGFATLMLMDARTVATGEDTTRELNRVDLIGEQTLREEGAGGLTSSAQCHIMGWEFPFHWGYLPGALPAMRNSAYGSMTSMEDDGGWAFHPDEAHKTLGADGTETMGTCANPAYHIAKWAAISGDPVALDALKKALARMRKFDVPRGAQGWECPILEPDVLASAYAVRAFVWAYMASGDKQCLEDARKWARTGLAFQYVWDDGEHPGMRYASIPVFGSTYLTHSWLGLPVQWCGLVYAYSLVELLRFDRNELWRKQIEGMVSSATYQQWTMENKELAGTYPDSFARWFAGRNGVYINPEDIVINALAMNGHDVGLRSATTELGGGPVHVTAPVDFTSVKGEKDGLEIAATYLPGEVVYLTVAPVALKAGAVLRTGNLALGENKELKPGSVGWAYDAGLRILTVGVKADARGSVGLRITGLQRQLPPPPAQAQGQWNFETDLDGWGQANSCSVGWKDGAMRMTVTGFDPYAFSGPAYIDTATHKKLGMRVRLSAGTEVGLFWRTTTSPGFGQDKQIGVPVPADGQWHEIIFDLSGNKLWSGKVQQIRLDIEPPEVAPGATLDVDWIRPK